MSNLRATAHSAPLHGASATSRSPGWSYRPCWRKCQLGKACSPRAESRWALSHKSLRGTARSCQSSPSLSDPGTCQLGKPCNCPAPSHPPWANTCLSHMVHTQLPILRPSRRSMSRLNTRGSPLPVTRRLPSHRTSPLGTSRNRPGFLSYCSTSPFRTLRKLPRNQPLRCSNVFLRGTSRSLLCC